MCYIGIDGGGTRSRLVAVDKKYGVIRRNEGGSTNIASNSIETVTENIKMLLSDYDSSSIKAVCIGSAGIDVQENVECMRNIFKSLDIKCPVFAVNDAELILWAEMKNDPGIVIISGTGSVAYGKNHQGDMERCGGWGHILDDDGSGYWIGKEAVRRALLSADGRGRTTDLTELIKDHFRICNIKDVIPIIYSGNFNKQKISSLAVLAERGTLLGDEVSKEIIEEAAGGLMKMAAALINNLGLNEVYSRIILSGGNIVNNKYMQQLMIDKIKSRYINFSADIARQEPVMGAVYLAVKKLEID